MTIPASHLLFIPLVFGLGLLIGWLAGTARQRRELEELKRIAEQHERQQAAARLAAAGDKRDEPPGERGPRP